MGSYPFDFILYGFKKRGFESFALIERRCLSTLSSKPSMALKASSAISSSISCSFECSMLKPSAIFTYPF